MGLRAGLDWCGKSRPTGIRSPDRPARRQSLYRLRDPAHYYIIIIIIIIISISLKFLTSWFLLLFLSVKRHNALWTSTSNEILLHSLRSLTITYLFFISIIFTSSSTSNLHILRGLPIFLFPSIVAVAI